MWGVGQTTAKDVRLWHLPELMSRAGWWEKEMRISASSRLPISLKFSFQFILIIFVFYFLTCSKQVIHIRAGSHCPNSPKGNIANLEEFSCHEGLLRKECDNSSIKLPDEQYKYFPVFPQGIWKSLCIQIHTSEGCLCSFIFCVFLQKRKKKSFYFIFFFFLFFPKWRVLL